MNTLEAAANPEFAAFVSIDWADRQHAWALKPTGCAPVEQGELKNTPEAIQEWAQGLAQRFGGRPVAVALEQRRGAVIAMLSKYAHLVLYPVHPTTLANYRKSFYPSGAKSDPGDTLLQLELLLQHRDRLAALKPDTVETRKLQLLVEHRRKLVNDKTAYSNHLTGWLKQIFPQMLQWFDDPAAPIAGAFLLRWPTLEDVRRARQSTLRKFFTAHNSRSQERIEERLAEIGSAVTATHDAALLEVGVLAVGGLVKLIAELRQAIAHCDEKIHQTAHAHPDFHLITSFPGAGQAMGPRLLAALGTQRERFASASQLQCQSGIAPVVVSSGNQRWVHWRWACPKFVRQTFHEWAQHTMKKCQWAREFYQRKRTANSSHHAAIRALAFKWLRILYRCWVDQVPYDEAVYLAARARRATQRPQNTSPSSPVEIKCKPAAGFLKFVEFSS